MVSPARIKTNRLLAKAFNLNDFLDPTRLAHDELQYYNELTRLFDKIISHHVDWLDSPEARKVFYEKIQNREEYFNTIDSDLDDIVRDASLSADRIIEKIYRKGLNYGYKDINRLPLFNDACKYGLKATQEYNFELISNVSNDLRDSIKHHIFRGVAEGQTVHEVARAITDCGLQPLEGKTLSAYQRASLIARTEIARAMTTGRLQSYANYGVEKVKILTAGDDHVCPICLEAAHVFNGEKTYGNIIGERVYDLDKASDLVPFHPACRCSVIAHIEHYNDISQKPLDNPRFMDCSPEESTLLPLTFWSKREVKESLKGIVEDADLDMVTEHVFEFIIHADEYYPKCESGASFDSEFKPIEKFIKGTHKGVDVQDNENGRGFGLIIHSHTSGLPFPSDRDIKTILEYNSKYNIIYTPIGLIVVKNNLNKRVTPLEDSFKEYKQKKNEILNIINTKYDEFKQKAINDGKINPHKQASISTRDYIKKNGQNYANQLDSFFDDNVIEIIFVNP
ncbi:phage minor head protein [Methanobrevibacter sp.]